MGSLIFMTPLRQQSHARAFLYKQRCLGLGAMRHAYTFVHGDFPITALWHREYSSCTFVTPIGNCPQ